MIDEATFATKFGALWTFLTPSMEHFVRSANLDKYERYEAPIVAEIDPDFRAVISEAAFIAVNRSIEASKEVRQIVNEEVEKLIEESCERIAGLAGVVAPNSVKNDVVVRELFLLSDSIKKFFEHYNSGIKLYPEPKFRGCGYIDECAGDYACGKTLAEMKNVERNFRATDIRQLLTYLFLDWASGDNRFSWWVLLNARKGIYLEGSLEDLTRGCSGKNPNVLFEEMLYNVSSGDLSR